MSVSEEDKLNVLSIVLGCTEGDIEKQLNMTLETFSEGDREFMMGYLEGYADAYRVIQKAQEAMDV